MFNNNSEEIFQLRSEVRALDAKLTALKESFYITTGPVNENGFYPIEAHDPVNTKRRFDLLFNFLKVKIQKTEASAKLVKVTPNN